MVRRNLTLLGSACLLMFVLGGARANADRVHFRYVGGRWSHERHIGWHRYWGGPEIGFYYAPAPVYIVSGYSESTYYTGPDFWYSNPSFGLSLNFGGGGYGHGDYHHGDYHHGDHGDQGHSGTYHHGDYSGGGYNRGDRNGGGSYNRGSHSSGDHNGGSHSSGDHNGGGHNGGDRNGGSRNGGDRNGGGNGR